MAGPGFSEALNVSPWMAWKAHQNSLTLQEAGAGNSKSDQCHSLPATKASGTFWTRFSAPEGRGPGMGRVNARPRMAGPGFSEALNVSPWMAWKAHQNSLTLQEAGAGNSKSDQCHSLPATKASGTFWTRFSAPEGRGPGMGRVNARPRMAGPGFSEALNVSPWMAWKAHQNSLTLQEAGAGNSKSDQCHSLPATKASGTFWTRFSAPEGRVPGMGRVNARPRMAGPGFSEALNVSPWMAWKADQISLTLHEPGAGTKACPCYHWMPMFGVVREEL